MQSLPFHGLAPYKRELRLFEPSAKPRGIILLAHGMAEHIDRYARLATALAAVGYVVAGYNHLGHGEEAQILGFFAEENGWQLLIDNLKTALDLLKNRYPGIPAVLLGHSMGSFLAMEFVLQHPDALSALVLSGTAWQEPFMVRAGMLPARLLCWLGKGKQPSRLLDALVFSANNAAFKSEGSAYAWLSRDEEEVQRYEHSPLCGFVFTASGFLDLFHGLLQLTELSRLSVLPKDLPIVILSGAADAVGKNGEGPRVVLRQYQEAGLRDASLKLYPGARHELFNETNREEVTKDLITWLDQSLSG